MSRLFAYLFGKGDKTHLSGCPGGENNRPAALPRSVNKKGV